MNEIAPMPAELLELLKNGKQHTSAVIESKIPVGKRNAALASLAGTMRRRGACEETILAALEAENRSRCELPLEGSEVRAIAGSIARYEPSDPIPKQLAAGAAELPAEATEQEPPMTPLLSDLLGRVARFVRRFVLMSEAQAVVAALWVAHTWAIDAAEATPFLNITSPEPEAGKTRLLEVLDLLVRRPLRAASLTAAVLYTKVQEESPTLLIDETDSIFGPKAKKENDELRGLLNAGNRRGSKTYRCSWEGRRRVIESFEVFCPRALAGIGRLPETIERRSFFIRLKRKMKTEHVERLGPREMKRVKAEARELRADLERCAAASINVLREADPDFPNGLTDRQEEGAQPLLAIADLAGGDWPEQARAAIVRLCTGATPEDDSLGVRLLRDCEMVFNGRGIDRIHSTDLCSALRELEESPWNECRRGEPISSNWLARVLKGFEIRSSQVWVDGKNRNGYERSSFLESWERWVPVSAASPPRTAFETLETLELNTGGGFLHFSRTLEATSPRVSKNEESSIMTGTLEGLEFQGGSLGVRTPPGDFVEEFVGLKRLLSAAGPGWAVAPSGKGDGDLLLVRDETVEPPSHLSHLRRFLVPDLGEEMIPTRDSHGRGSVRSPKQGHQR